MPCPFAVIAITHDMVKLIFTTKLDSIGCFMYCNARWYLDCYCPNPFLSKKICYLVQNVQQHYQTNVLWIATEALRNDVKVPMQIKKHSCSTAICTPKAMIWTDTRNEMKGEKCTDHYDIKPTTDTILRD